MTFNLKYVKSQKSNDYPMLFTGFKKDIQNMPMLNQCGNVVLSYHSPIYSGLLLCIQSSPLPLPIHTLIEMPLSS